MANFDIYENKQYKWTQATDEDIKEAGVPFVELTEYENHTDLIFQNILFLRRSYVNGGTGANMTSFSDLYKGTYQIFPTGNSYKFPYLGKQPMHMETQYKQIDIEDDGKNWGLQIEKLKASTKQWFSAGARTEWDTLGAALNPSSTWDSWRGDNPVKDGNSSWLYHYNNMTEKAPFRVGASLSKQSPKVYESSNTGQFSTTFNLINETDDLIKSHYKFIIRMMMSLAPSYPDPMRVHVPYVYSVSIPSLTQLPLAFISSFDAAPIGAAKMVGKIYTPEGWKITIAFNSLFPVSKQLLSLLGTADMATILKDFKLPEETIKQLGKTNDPANILDDAGKLAAGQFSTATEAAIDRINSNYQLGGD